MLRQLVERVLYSLKIAAFLRRTIWRRRVRIALYHSIDAERFEKHINILNRIYDFVSLDTLVDAMERNDWSGIPDNALVITFDDGARDFYELRIMWCRIKQLLGIDKRNPGCRK